MSQFDSRWPEKERSVPAESFVATLVVNVDNFQLDDKAFREFIRNTLPIVQGAPYPQGSCSAGG